MAFSDWEQTLLCWSQWNALARRDVTRHFQTTPDFWSVDGLALLGWRALLGWWGAVGVGSVLLRVWVPEVPWFTGLGALVLGAAMAMAALHSAPVFTRERAQKTLTALQLTALSSGDIVIGKIAATLLICARSFGGPLGALSILALSYGPQSAVATLLLGVSCVGLTATGGATLSLWGRKTEFVAAGTLAAIVGLWLLLPALYIAQGDFFRAPAWLEWMWLAPLRALFAAHSDLALALALAQLAVLCALMTLILGGLCLWQLGRTRAEDEATGVLQRDLSAHWH